MKKKFLRVTAFLLCLLTFAGCTTTEPPAEEGGKIDSKALFYTLVTEGKYDAPLENAGESTVLYFPDMPAGTQLLFFKADGYFADQVLLATLSSADQMEAVKAQVKTHLENMRGQFLNYLPDEVKKIDSAIIWEKDKLLILCVSADQAAAQKILDDPANPDYTVPEGTVAPPETDPTTQPSTTPTTEPETVPPTQPETVPPTVPTQPADPDLDLSSIHYYSDGVTIRVGNSAYENHVFIRRSVENYTKLINKAAKSLGKDVNTYVMLIPTAIGVVLPDEAIPNYSAYIDQKESIETAYGMMDSNVIPVKCFDNLRAHRNEYLYFRTDFHWNGPAAYYAYETFCKVKGIKPYTMAERKEYQFDGFLGGLYQNAAKKDPILGENPDTVYAYAPKCDVTMRFYDNKGNSTLWPVIVNVDDWTASSKYSCFAGSDNPLTLFKNADLAGEGSVCIVVKESFGNALMPYIADHYETVYEIDYRHWDGNLAEFAKEVGAQDVLFANNMSMLRNDMLIGMLGEII